MKLACDADTNETKLRGLALVAEWASDAGPVIDAACGTVEKIHEERNPNFKMPLPVIYRLSQLAAKVGKYDEARKLADELPAGGWRDWIKAEIVRERLSRSKEPAEASLMELPDDPTKLHLGHAWGRLHIARHAARITGDRNGAKQFDSWPKGTIHPFALAGYSLGLQDRDLTP